MIVSISIVVNSQQELWKLTNIQDLGEVWNVVNIHSVVSTSLCTLLNHLPAHVQLLIILLLYTVLLYTACFNCPQTKPDSPYKRHSAKCWLRGTRSSNSHKGVTFLPHMLITHVSPKAHYSIYFSVIYLCSYPLVRLACSHLQNMITESYFPTQIFSSELKATAAARRCRSVSLSRPGFTPSVCGCCLQNPKINHWTFPHNGSNMLRFDLHFEEVPGPSDCLLCHPSPDSGERWKRLLNHVASLYEERINRLPYFWKSF